jgi:hypothetical protein
VASATPFVIAEALKFVIEMIIRSAAKESAFRFGL